MIRQQHYKDVIALATRGLRYLEGTIKEKDEEIAKLKVVVDALKQEIRGLGRGDLPFEEGT